MSPTTPETVGNGAEKGNPFAGIALSVLLVAIAIVGPLVAFAGIQLVWPQSDQTIGVALSAVVFVQGTDYPDAEAQGWLSNWSLHNNGASFIMNISGLSGGTVTIDDYVSIDARPTITKYRLEIAQGGVFGPGGLDPAPLLFKIRIYDATQAPPTDDLDAQVCGVLDYMAPTGTISDPPAGCAVDTKVQLIFQMANDTDPLTSTLVAIRPTDITS